MTRRLYRQMGGKEHTGEIREDWMVGVEGIVAVNEDPEGQHRIKVVIPLIDENVVYDEWVVALVPWVGPDGYGPVHTPEIGSEVVMFGRLGERHELFYVSRFNEDFKTPTEFADGSRGLKCDLPYRLLCDLLIQIVSGTQLLMRGEERADVQGGIAVDLDAPDVRLKAGGGVSVHAQGEKVGFLGAAPAARQNLPGPASDLDSCVALTNALRLLVKTFGLGQ